MKSGSKKKKPSRGSSGTYGVAPLGYVEVAGSREALQKAASEITRLTKENRLLKKELEKKDSLESWNSSHLNETEQTVIEAYLRGDFEGRAVKDFCQQLSQKHGRSLHTYRQAYNRLKRYGTFDLLTSSLRTG